jgi:hypothetical protein
MTLFPQLSDTYYTNNDHEILKLMDYTYAKNITLNQSFWNEAEVDQRFRAGDQSLWNDLYGNLPAFRRRQFNFNRIRRITNMITGYQRQHRKSTICTPIENSDQQTADQFSKILLWDDQKNHVLETISDAFDGAIVTGMNLLSVWMDYRNDPVNGDIAVDNVAFNGYLIDPYFKKMDLSDCNNIWTRKYLSRSQVKSLLPGRESEILDMKGWGNRDGKFQFMPESYNYGMQDLLTYDEFWYLDSRKQKLICDVQTGETMEWRGQDEDLQDFMGEYPQIHTLEQEIQTVKLAIVVQGKVMYNGPNPLGIDRYPFVPVWAYYEPQMADFPWRIQGVVRGLRDAQYLYNRRRIIELDILESQMTSGFMYKENALVNPKDVFLQGQGRGLALKANAQPGVDVVKIEAPQIPPSMIQLSELLGKEVQEISGVSEELLGMANDDKAGILSMLRQGANLTTLQGLFDNLDYAQKILGDIRMQLIQSNWTPGKVQRVIGEEPSQQFYNRAFGKYKAIVEDGLNTSTQRQMQFAQLLQLREMGIPVPAEILVESSTLQNKEKLTDALTAQEQQASQAAQMQQQTQIELLKAQIEDLHARAVANQGLGHERASRIQENQALAVERRAAAHKDMEEAELSKVKAVKELTTIDLEQLHKAVEILKLITEKQEEKEATASQGRTAETAAKKPRLKAEAKRKARAK